MTSTYTCWRRASVRAAVSAAAAASRLASARFRKRISRSYIDTLSETADWDPASAFCSEAICDVSASALAFSARDPGLDGAILALWEICARTRSTSPDRSEIVPSCAIAFWAGSTTVCASRNRATSSWVSTTALVASATTASAERTVSASSRAFIPLTSNSACDSSCRAIARASSGRNACALTVTMPVSGSATALTRSPQYA